VIGTRTFAGCLAALTLTVWLGAQTPPEREKASASIRLVETRGRTVIEVTGLREEIRAGIQKADEAKWAEAFQVLVQRDGKDREGQPAMLGTHTRSDKGTLQFEPRFPLVRGVRYRAVFDPNVLPGVRGEKPVEVVLSLPKPIVEPSTVVARVYPSTDKVPENLLKFYLHFSAPMSQGNSYRHIHLLDAKGKVIELPFLELDQELWDPSGTRFTLFFDPGRIKRGLKPREEVGPALEEGKRYTLVIDRTWDDAEGNPLKESFRKTFSVGAPDDTQPDPKTWKLSPPAARSREALRVTFPKPMDAALSQRVVWVVDAEGKRVTGKVTLAERETGWLFTPEAAWRAGEYQLVADTRLEDLAGNSIGRPFEVDVLRPVEREVKTETVKVGFRVKE
jgi:hypothetical protein